VQIRRALIFWSISYVLHFKTLCPAPHGWSPSGYPALEGSVNCLMVTVRCRAAAEIYVQSCSEQWPGPVICPTYLTARE